MSLKRIAPVVFLSACALGLGEAGTSTLEWTLEPTGLASTGLDLQVARIQIEEIEAEFRHDDTHPDDSHHHLASDDDGRRRRGGDDDRGDDDDDRHDDDDHPHGDDDGGRHGDDHAHHLNREGPNAAISLLEGEVALGQTTGPAGMLERIDLDLDLLSSGEGQGCLLFARGTFEGAGLPVPVEICLPGPEVDDLRLSFALVAADGSSHHIALQLAMDRIFGGVDWPALDRDASGTILVDGTHNATTAGRLRQNLLSAFSAESHTH